MFFFLRDALEEIMKFKQSVHFKLDLSEVKKA